MQAKTGTAQQAVMHYYNGALAATKQSVFIGPGNIYGFEFENNDAASDVFIQFYNKLVADVTVGTTAPDFTFRVPAGANFGKDAQNFCLEWMSLGCVVAATSTRTGGSAPATALTVNIWYWQS